MITQTHMCESEYELLWWRFKWDRLFLFTTSRQDKRTEEHSAFPSTRETLCPINYGTSSCRPKLSCFGHSKIHQFGLSTPHTI